MIRRLHLTFLVLLCFTASYIVSCSTAPRQRASLQFKEAPSPIVKCQFSNWQLPPHELETVIYKRGVTGKLHGEEAKRTAQGTTGAIYLVTALADLQHVRGQLHGSLPVIGYDHRIELIHSVFQIYEED